MSLAKIVDQLDLSTGQITLNSENLVSFEPIGGSLTTEDVEKANKWFKQKFKNKSFSTLIEVGDNSTIHSEIIQLLRDSNREWKNGADAFVLKNFAQKLVMDLYLQFNLPLVPTRTYLKKAKAVRWLHQQRFASTALLQEKNGDY